MASKNRKTDRMVTGVVRLSYAHLFEAHSNKPEKEKKFSTCMLVPKTDDISHLKKAAQALGIAEFGPGFVEGVKMGRFKWPFRDGDTDYSGDAPAPEKVGHVFFNATGRQKPQLIGPDKTPITDPEMLGSGDYARVSVNFYTFNTEGNRGIACGLGNVQLVRKGEPLAGGPRAIDEFDELEAPAAGSAGDDFGDL